MQVQERGDGDGAPLLYFHGTPGSAADGPTHAHAAREGVRLFTCSRPGYAGTPTAPAATLLDVAAEAVDAVGAFGVEKLVVVGWSGGGPYALASALKRPHLAAGVGLLASWAPMNPPHPGLPAPVRVFMHTGRRFPRVALRAALAAVGRTSEGQVDDIRRVAKPWGFSPEDVMPHAPVVAWHALHDGEVPIGPWENVAGLDLRREESSKHEPDSLLWDRVLRWARLLHS